MEIKYGNDRTKELKEKGMFKKHIKETKQKMIEKTPYTLDETAYFHSFVRG